VAGIEKNPVTYEPFVPELVGMKRKLALGKHSGKNSINSKLKELGIDNKFTVGEIVSILNQVKNKSILDKMEVSDKDFIDICKGMEG
jgi:isopropylmalate/homocitrate/citramalate synthase